MEVDGGLSYDTISLVDHETFFGPNVGQTMVSDVKNNSRILVGSSDFAGVDRGITFDFSLGQATPVVIDVHTPEVSFSVGDSDISGSMHDVSLSGSGVSVGGGGGETGGLMVVVLQDQQIKY